MELAEAATATFARHETFHPRHGWFRKGYAAARTDPLTFQSDDAPTRLGVGKNMARSIRFWALAAKLICESPGDGRRGAVTPTVLGDALFGDGGWDPYMEDPGTLWLLHWLLLAPPSRLPVWWLTFNGLDAVEFSEETLRNACDTQLGAAPWRTPPASSVRKDIAAVLRTYAPAGRTRPAPVETSWDSPLRELALIAPATATRRFRFRHGPKPDLPAAVVAYAALDWAARRSETSRSITVGRLAAEPGAPGRGFKLSENDMVASLEDAAATSEHITVSVSAGNPQLSWAGAAEDAAPHLLDAYYATEPPEAVRRRAGHAGDAAATNGTQ